MTGADGSTESAHLPGQWRVRDAHAGDTPAIAQMVRDLATYEKALDQVASDAASFARLMFPDDGSTPMAFCLIAEISDGTGWQPVGFAAWYVTFSTWTGAQGIWLEDLYVAPEQRGSGVGRALLARLAQIAVQRGYQRVEWWVLTWNEPALGFYRRLGADGLDEWIHYRIDGSALAELGAT